MFLSAPPQASTFRKLDICIATYEFIGFYKNGGIGTLNTGLAIALSRLGHRVTVFLGLVPISSDDTYNNQLISEYRTNESINIVIPERPPEVLTCDYLPHSLAMSYTFNKWLEQHSFDVVNMDDYKNLGFYPVMAQKLGIAHSSTVFITQIHGPMDWLLDGQLQLFSGNNDAKLIDSERFQITNSTYTIATSEYLYSFLQSCGLEFNIDSTFKLKTISPFWLKGFSDNCDANGVYYKPICLAFFGRQEHRKGFYLFCDLINKLIISGYECDIHVFGKFSVSPLGLHSGQYLYEKSLNWPNKVFVHNNLGSADAIRRIKELRALVVIPSLTDNLPNTVIECISNKIPFITTSSGGQKEIIDISQHDQFVFEPTLDDLERGIGLFINECSPVDPARYAFNALNLPAAWSNFFIYASDKKSLEAPRSASTTCYPSITIGIVHYNQYFLLLQTLHALERQSYKNFKILILDDGSSCIHAQKLITDIECTGKYKTLEIGILRNPNTYLGAARNKLLKYCQTEYIIFMDDDNFAMPELVETLIRSIKHSEYSVVTSLAFHHYGPNNPMSSRQESFHHPITYFPIGHAVLSGNFQNNYGDANGIYNVEHIRLIGGFFEERDVPYEDWNLFYRLIASGYKIGVVPRPLFFYRIRSGSMLRTTPPNKPFLLKSEVFSISDQPNWVKKYIHQSALSHTALQQMNWLKSSYHHQQYLRNPINGHTDSNRIVTDDYISNLLIARNEIHGRRRSSSNTIIRNLNNPTLYLKQKLDLLRQSRIKGEQERYLQSKTNFSIHLPDLRPGSDFNHVDSVVDVGTGWKTVNCDWTGLLIHPIEGSDNSIILFDHLISRHSRFLVAGFAILHDQALYPASVRLALFQRDKLTAPVRYTDFYEILPNSPETKIVLSLANLFEMHLSENEDYNYCLVITSKAQVVDYCHLKLTSLSYSC